MGCAKIFTDAATGLEPQVVCSQARFHQYRELRNLTIEREIQAEAYTDFITEIACADDPSTMHQSIHTASEIYARISFITMAIECVRNSLGLPSITQGNDREC